MNSVVRSLALSALHRLKRPAAAAVGKKSKQTAAAATAGYSTAADRLAAYRSYRTEGGYLLLPALVAIGAGTWFITTAVTRYLRTPPAAPHGTTTTTTPVEVVGVAASPE